ncbi:MAG: GNAT family N-acetyltransferase [Anaerolineae bacterium]|nr:GNAT family N-acetyltransferase [Anaerolineae bacterium]
MSIALPQGYSIRPPTLDDVTVVVELANRCDHEYIGRPTHQEEDFRNDWQSPSLNPKTDLRVICDPRDTIVGYAGVWDAEPHVLIYGWANVHPHYRRLGIGTYLAQWVEARARQAVPQAPGGTRVTIQQFRFARDEAGQALLLGQGYQLARHFFRMLIALDTPPPEPVWPEGISVETFDRERDLRMLIKGDQDGFRDHWGYVEQPFDVAFEDWSHWIDHDPNHDPTLWFLPKANGQLAGLCLSTSKMAEDPDMAYVMSLAVMPDFRRRGLGLALLQHTFGEFYRRGKRRVSLDVDANSLTGALRLYERAGMHVLRQSACYEKVLRPGEDLATRTLDD